MGIFPHIKRPCTDAFKFEDKKKALQGRATLTVTLPLPPALKPFQTEAVKEDGDLPQPYPFPQH